MRIAVFTSQFPAKQCTFFSRDIRGLLECSIEVDIYPIYPLDPRLWRFVPEILNEDIFPRSRVHHITIQESLIPTTRAALSKSSIYINDLISILFSAAHFGFKPVAKSFYAAIIAGGWAQQNKIKYDHILAYWGNYPGTCAYLFHRLLDLEIPFSIFIHAGTDLYRDQVYLREKILYSDNIISCIKFNSDFLVKLYPDHAQEIIAKTHIHYHGLDFKEIKRYRHEKQNLNIIAVGRFVRGKGFDYLLRAIKKLDENGIDLKVELVGGGVEKNRLRNLAKELKIIDKVTLTEWIPSQEVLSKIQQAMVLVHPSPILGDGAPNVIKEAMALGTPVVASNIAGIPELLDQGRCGELIPPKDIEALANTIEKLIQDKPLREHYSNVGRKFVEQKCDLWKNGEQLARILYSTKRSKKKYD